HATPVQPSPSRSKLPVIKRRGKVAIPNLTAERQTKLEEEKRRAGSAKGEEPRAKCKTAGKTGPYRVKPFRSGYQPGVDRLRLNQLAGELETEEFFQAQGK